MPFYLLYYLLFLPELPLLCCSMLIFYIVWTSIAVLACLPACLLACLLRWLYKKFGVNIMGNVIQGERRFFLWLQLI